MHLAHYQYSLKDQISQIPDFPTDVRFKFSKNLKTAILKRKTGQISFFDLNKKSRARNIIPIIRAKSHFSDDEKLHFVVHLVDNKSLNRRVYVDDFKNDIFHTVFGLLLRRFKPDDSEISHIFS